MEEVEFLFDNQLVAALEKLIKDAKKKLLLVSPYIDLDSRIADALDQKRALPDFQLFVLFGKCEENYQRSFKKDSFSFLKSFPCVEIRYNERLHAKFYQNEFEYIMTTMNLYDYSLANNIEVGVRGKYASKGFLNKTLDEATSILAESTDRLGKAFFGGEDAESPLLDLIRSIIHHGVFTERALYIRRRVGLEFLVKRRLKESK